MQAHSLKETIIRVKGGNTGAFAAIITAFEKPLFVLAGSFIRDQDRVEELVQEVFLTAFRNIQAFNPERGEFSSWLYQIARNKCLNEIKRKKESPLPLNWEAPGRENPMADLLHKELFARLDDALAQLPFKLRVVFVLAEFDELTYDEIAAVEKINTGTVRSRLSRARGRLRQILKHHGFGIGRGREEDK